MNIPDYDSLTPEELHEAATTCAACLWKGKDIQAVREHIVAVHKVKMADITRIMTGIMSMPGWEMLSKDEFRQLINAGIENVLDPSPHRPRPCPVCLGESRYDLMDHLPRVHGVTENQMFEISKKVLQDKIDGLVPIGGLLDHLQRVVKQHATQEHSRSVMDWHNSN